MLSSYLWCPRQLYIEKVIGIRQPPSPALTLGSIIHNTHEIIGAMQKKLVLDIKYVDSKRIQEHYQNAYSKALREAIIKNKQTIQSLGLDMVQVFREQWDEFRLQAINDSEGIANLAVSTGLIGEELWKAIIPKVKTEYRLESEELGLKGIIDRLEVYPEKLVPVELKTGKPPKQGVWDGHRIQIGAYIMLLQNKVGSENNYGIIEYVDTKINIKREVILNEFLKHEIIELKKKVEELLVQKNIPGPCKNKTCVFCKEHELPENRDLLRTKLSELFAKQAKSVRNL